MPQNYQLANSSSIIQKNRRWKLTPIFLGIFVIAVLTVIAFLSHYQKYNLIKGREEGNENKRTLNVAFLPAQEPRILEGLNSSSFERNFTASLSHDEKNTISEVRLNFAE
jgi:hypothetical protein